MHAPQPRWLVGRTIVRYENNADPENPTSGGGPSHDPTIFFDDGSSIAFIAEELESGDGYGIFPVYRAASRKGGKR
jgi:hypothetical protein